MRKDKKEKDVMIKIYGKLKYFIYSFLLFVVFAIFLWDAILYIGEDEMDILSAVIRVAIALVPLFFAGRVFLIFARYRRIRFCKDKFVDIGLFHRREFLYKDCEFTLVRYSEKYPVAAWTLGMCFQTIFGMGSIKGEVWELIIITDKENCGGIEFSNKHYRNFEKKINMELFNSENNKS